MTLTMPPFEKFIIFGRKKETGVDGVDRKGIPAGFNYSVVGFTDPDDGGPEEWAWTKDLRKAAGIKAALTLQHKLAS